MRLPRHPPSTTNTSTHLGRKFAERKAHGRKRFDGCCLILVRCSRTARPCSRRRTNSPREVTALGELDLTRHRLDRPVVAQERRADERHQLSFCSVLFRFVSFRFRSSTSRQQRGTVFRFKGPHPPINLPPSTFNHQPSNLALCSSPSPPPQPLSLRNRTTVRACSPASVIPPVRMMMEGS